MDKDFLNRLLQTFKSEAAEYIQNISLAIADAGTETPENFELKIEEVYRQAHSLKGAARAVGLQDIESACQNMENVFSAVKRREKNLTRGIVDVLLRMLDNLTNYLDTSNEKERLDVVLELDNDVDLLNEFLTSVAGMKVGEAEEAPPAPPQIVIAPAPNSRPAPVKEYDPVPAPDDHRSSREIHSLDGSTQFDVFRVPGSKLDSLFTQTQELLFSKLAFEAVRKEADETTNLISEFKKSASELEHLRIDLMTSDFAMTKADSALFELLYDKIEKTSSLLTELNSKMKRLSADTAANTGNLDTNLFRLMEDVKGILMTPFSNRLNTFPKMIREISRDLGKEVAFKMQGAEIEIDKRILDAIKDPLIHVLRNSIDHGIEKPITRRNLGKPEEGRLDLKISSGDGNIIQIVIEDDGQGIDPKKVKEAAVKRNIITEAEAAKLTSRQAIDLIFVSDVSTSPVITDLSGRGLGMAIVKEKLENLDGEILVETHIGTGTKITLSVPLYITTMRGIIVSASGRYFAIPTSKVERVVRVSDSEIKTVESKKTIIYNGQPISYIELYRILGLPAVDRSSEDELKTCLVFFSAGRLSAVSIERIVNETEILLKPFTLPIKKIRNLLGAAILGDGKLIPVINPQDLVMSIEKFSGAEVTPGVQAIRKAGKNILVADDSLTSRMLIKDILETNGYLVRTAVDGLDALTLLKTASFDLLVSDVEMPRMSGFELTAEIRRDAKLANLPVILVTGLSRREDRERGIDAGANAYIVKGSFEQSNLLETISRMI